MNSNIVYIGRFSYDNGAAWTRVENISKILKRNGDDVFFVSNAAQIPNFKPDRHHTVVSYRNKRLSSILNLFDLVTGLLEYRDAVSVIERESAKYVFLYNESGILAKRIISYCHNHGIKVFTDTTEWYSITPIGKGIADWLYTNSVNRRIMCVDKKMDGAIAISPFLKEYYDSIHVNTVLIPPVFEDVYSRQESTISFSKPLSLVYAGAPATKDLIIPILNTLEKINSTNLCVLFNLVGISEDDLRKTWKNFDYKRIGINCYGRQTRERAIEIVATSHFTILLRRAERYAKAGYSTKFSESLSVGTPIICNHVGGADEDIIDGKTGFVLKTCMEDELYAILRKLCDMSESDYYLMRREALKFGKNRYMGKNYDNLLRNLVV